MNEQVLNLIIQACGIIAMIFCIAAFLTKNRKTILIMQIIGMAMWTAHFFLKQSYAGAAMNGLAVIRAIFYVQRDKHKWANSKIIPAVFVCAFIGMGILSSQLGDNLWWLPVIAMTTTSIGLFFKDEQKMRFINLFSSPPWIIYNALQPSPFQSVFTESMTMVSVIIGLIVYRRKKKSAVTEGSEATETVTETETEKTE